MEKTFFIDNHQVKFSTGTAIAPVSGKRVDVLAAYDESAKSWKTTTSTDWLPQEDDEASDMLHNFDWETSSALSDFWPDDEY